MSLPLHLAGWNLERDFEGRDKSKTRVNFHFWYLFRRGHLFDSAWKADAVATTKEWQTAWWAIVGMEDCCLLIFWLRRCEYCRREERTHNQGVAGTLGQRMHRLILKIPLWIIEVTEMPTMTWLSFWLYMVTIHPSLEKNFTGGDDHFENARIESGVFKVRPLTKTRHGGNSSHRRGKPWTWSRADCIFHLIPLQDTIFFWDVIYARPALQLHKLCNSR